MPMASEVEAKWWLIKPDDAKIVRALGLQAVPDYNVGNLISKARELSEAEPERFDYSDKNFQKTDLSSGYSASDLEARLRLEDNKIHYGGRFIEVSVKPDNDIREEYTGLVEALKKFFSGEDTSSQAVPRNQIRIREDRVTRKYSFTLKTKLGQGDEKTKEYEFFAGSEDEIKEFLGTLGYNVSQPASTKVKKGERYTLQRGGFKIDVDFNEIGVLPGARILEIETTPPILEQGDVTVIYNVATQLGIRNSNLTVAQGGNQETRLYITLIDQIKTAS